MEIVIATLVHIAANRDADALAHVRQVADAVHNTPGVIAFQTYRGRQQHSYYLMLSTWEDMEVWQKDQEQHDPQQFLLEATDLLLVPPEQWQMQYRWGYHRPAKQPIVATAHIITLPPEQARIAQREWMSNLRKQAGQPSLAFAFLAQETDHDATTQLRAVKPQQAGISAMGKNAYFQQGTTLFALLSWASEMERDQFYRDPHYQTLKTRLESIAVTRILPLEQI